MRKKNSLILLFVGIAAIADAAFGQGGITLAGADYVAPSQIRVAPGQVITFKLTGLKTILPANAPAVRENSVPLPKSLAGISVTLTQVTPQLTEQLPIFAIQQFNSCGATYPLPGPPSPDCMITALTVQIPFDVTVPNPLADFASIVSTTVTINETGGNSRPFTVVPVADNIHILTSCDLIVNPVSASCNPVVTRGDGSPVNPSNPAKIGEDLVLYAVGLGLTSPAVAAGTPTPAPAPSIVSQAGVSYNYTDPLGVQPSVSPTASPVPPTLFVGLTPGLVGLYQVNFRVLPPPGTFPSCSAVGPNLTLTLKTPQGTSDKATVCIDTTSTTP